MVSKFVSLKISSLQPSTFEENRMNKSIRIVMTFLKRLRIHHIVGSLVLRLEISICKSYREPDLCKEVE
jgi:hypothetical protein